MEEEVENEEDLFGYQKLGHNAFLPLGQQKKH